jgi:hypothetical protein
MPWSMLGKICVYEDEDEMRGNVRAFMIHYAIPGSTHLSQIYVHSMCNNILCGIIIIPFHGIPGIETVYMCIRDAQQREICERLLNDTTVNTC